MPNRLRAWHAVDPGLRRDDVLMVMAALFLTACSPKFDMQGVDPTDYYTAHPIKNAIESHNTAYNVHFAPGKSRLTNDEIARLRAGLRYASPQATRGLQLQFAEADGVESKLSSARRHYLVKLLTSLSFPMENALAEPSATVTANSVRIAVTYDTVVLPDCPDWRRSPVTTYSNTTQGNYGCANEVNLGLMVADPHDLVQGTGNVDMDTQRTSQVLNDYRNGKDPTPPAPPPTSSATSVAGGVTAAVGQ